MTEKKNSGKLRLRQQKFIKGKLEGKSSARAARDAGYSATTADHAEREIASRPAVQEEFKRVLEKAGLTQKKLATRLSEGMNAKETKFFAHQGKVIDKRNVVDFGTRLNYATVGLKLHGLLIDRHEITGQLSLAEILAASFGGGEDEGE